MPNDSTTAVQNLVCMFFFVFGASFSYPMLSHETYQRVWKPALSIPGVVRFLFDALFVASLGGVGNNY